LSISTTVTSSTKRWGAMTATPSGRCKEASAESPPWWRVPAWISAIDAPSL
jgi:hypothetical protein